MGRDDKSGLFIADRQIGEHFGDLYGAFWCQGILSHELKEVIRLRNAQITDCGY